MQARLLLSTQRSGSHFLKSFIEAHYPGVVCTGEILREPLAEMSAKYPSLADHPEFPLFWKWYEAEAVAGRISVLPDERMNVFNAYLEVISDLVEHKDLILDLKYNCIRSLSGYWDTEYGSNDFVTFIRAREIPVLHLIRKNVLRIIVSNKLALHTGQWHLKEERNPYEPLPKLRLNPKNVLFEIRYALKLTEDYQNRFSGYERYEEIEYEDFVREQKRPESSLSKRAVGRFLEQTSVTPGVTELPFKKTTPEDPSEVVENWDELVRLLRATEYDWMAQTSLPIAA